MLFHGVDLLVWLDVTQRCITTGFSLMLHVTQPSNLAHSTVWELFREAKNKNLALFATFLRLGIVASFSIADCCPKKRRKWLCGGLLLRCQGGRESPIAKMLQRNRDFCFRNGLSTATGQIRRKTCEASDGNRADLWKGAGLRRWWSESREATAAGKIP